MGSSPTPGKVMIISFGQHVEQLSMNAVVSGSIVLVPPDPCQDVTHQNFTVAPSTAAAFCV